jgi:hypothetical protein
MAAKKLSSTEQTRSHPRQQRLRWILENRLAPNGKPFSERSLSMAAGRAPSHCTKLLAWPNKGKEQPINPAAVRSDYWKGYAKAGNVRTAWLMDGVGQRDGYEGDDAPASLAISSDEEEQLAREQDRFPSKVIVFRMAKKMGYHDAALLGLLLAKPKADDGTDPGEDYWWTVLDEKLDRVTQQKERLDAAKAIFSEKPA